MVNKFQIMRAKKKERKKERKGRVEGGLFMGVGFPDSEVSQ